MGVLLNHHILHRKLFPSRPPDHGLRHFDVLLIRERDGERDGFP